MKPLILIVMILVVFSNIDLKSNNEDHYFAGTIKARPFTCFLFSKAFNKHLNKSNEPCVIIRKEKLPDRSGVIKPQTQVETKSERFGKIVVNPDNSKCALGIIIFNNVSAENTQFRVFNTNGIEVFSCGLIIKEGNNDMRLETPYLAAGVYFSTLNIGDKTLFCKFLVM